MNAKKTALLLVIIICSFTTTNHARDKGTTGKLHFEIRDKDSAALIPGKLVFLQDGKIPDLQVPSRGLIASRSNTVYTANGQGSIDIPAGKYDVWFGRGLEYSVDKQQIEIKPGTEQHLAGQISREVETPGYVCGDMHLHTLTYSGHGDANVEERLISCIGEGLEWAVATDHNHHTDYRPVMRDLELTADMATAIGNEVSTPIGHFNAYPLADDTEVIPHDLHDAGKLFKIMREIDSTLVVQINHPRWPGAAYFSEKHLDEFFAESADATWSWEFDALEILNENKGLGWSIESDNPISVRQDWFNMLNNGRRFTGVGNSDSHTVEAIIAGVPRNYIASSTDDPSAISNSELARQIRNQNVSVSGGIYIEFSANDGQPIGSEVKLDGESIELQVRVQAAGWISCDSVLLVANGQVVQAFDVSNSSDVVRFQKTLAVSPEIDTWYLVIAKGSRSLTPMVKDGGVPNLPLGFTNPIWVDADGDGKYTSLRDYAANLVEQYRIRPSELLLQLEQRKDLQIPAIAELAAQKVPAQEMILDRLLRKQTAIRNRLLIYRQLAKIGSSEARQILNNAAKTAETPLEKITLASSLAALEDGTTEAGLKKQLEYLRDIYLDYHENSKMKNWQIWRSPEPLELSRASVSDSLFHPQNTVGKTVTRQKIPVSGAGIVARQTDPEPGVLYAYIELYSHYSGEMPFFLESAQNLTIWTKGQKFFHQNGRQDFAVLNLPMQKGKNSYLVEIAGDDGRGFLMEPLDYQKLIDEAIAGKTVHRHLAFGASSRLAHPHASKYSGGEQALTDGLRASTNYADGFWQGFEATDLDIVIDLRHLQKIRKISAGFLRDDNAWIFLPETVAFAISEDGEQFRAVEELPVKQPQMTQESFVRDIVIEMSNLEARYIRVFARNIRKNPDWHKAPGGKSWIFVDEILVE